MADRIVHASALGYRRSHCGRDLDLDVEDMVTLAGGGHRSDVTCAACLAVIDRPRPVTLRMPAESWALLKETLEADAQSAAFDRELRDRIRAALATVEER